MSNIKSLPIVEQPRVKFITKGKDHLTDVDLLALLISSGRQNLNALELSREVLTYFNHSLLNVARSSYSELMRVK